MFSPPSARRAMQVASCIATVLSIALQIACSRNGGERNASGRTSAIQVETRAGAPVLIRTPTAEFELNNAGYLRASLLRQGQVISLDDAQSDPRAGADAIVSGGKEIADFDLDLAKARVTEASDRLGAGKRIEVSGMSRSVPSLEKTIAVEVYDSLPHVAFSSTVYRNTGSTEIPLERVTTQRHVLNASLSDPKAAPFSMWSFHGSSEAWGKDDVMLVGEKFARANPMQVVMHNDENQTGGGIPVTAFWTGTVGEAIGHAEAVPLRLSMPVNTGSDRRVYAEILLDADTRLQPGQTYSTPLTFVSVFHGDFYEPLSMYSRMLQVKGVSLAHPTEADYQANWCGWGYEMDFTPKQMLGTIPKLKELGLKWATLDAGWFKARGDWEPRSDTFPDNSLQKVVKAYHDAGLHITLWWIPIVVEDGHGKDILNHRRYQLSNVVKEHPDWLILDKDGKPARATADLGALCPAVPEVQQYYKQLTERFIRDWDFDGHKLDFSYTVPACYNPKHHHKSPNESIEAVGEIYKIILDTTRALKPDSVTQACPCGTPPSLAWLPYIDQAVTADPVGARQVRLRTKMYKALLGPESAVYGDHVELTDVQLSNTLHEVDKGSDFASEVGVGAVLGTKFTWPNYGPKFKTVELTPQKETHWKKWIDIYNSKMLSRGKFLDLYIYGYDSPEAYAIEKDGRMYYAFYAQDKNKPWRGQIELRGLEPGKYRVVNYEDNTELGFVESGNPRLDVSFTNNLLLEASRASQ
ncbi:MAG TPA: glycoside hydrolase family 36 protein [Terriglobales bacterium]|nr:glycoside hydrolase family 36 protein [Terriglobales bacterium]